MTQDTVQTGAQTAEATEAAGVTTKVTAEALNKSTPLEGKTWMETVVRFRKTKETKEVDGKEVTVDVPARDPIQLFLPVPLLPEVVRIMAEKNEDGTLTKAQQYIVDLIQDAVVNRAKEITSDLLADGKEVTYSSFPLDQVAFEVIAALPAKERAGRGISEEAWKSFSESYAKFFLAQGLEKSKVETAAGLFVKRLQPAKHNKPLLEKLRTYLAAWFASEGIAEDDTLVTVYQFLDGKIEDFLGADDTKALDLI